MINLNNIFKKNSLSTLVTSSFIIIIIVTLASTALNYSRLKNFSYILSDITENSLIETAKAAELNNVLKEILYLTERLTNANNLASRRIAIRKLQQQELNLIELIGKFDNAIYLNNQVKTVRAEVVQLDKLVIQRITNSQQLQQLNEKIYVLHDNIVAQLNLQKPSNEIERSLMVLMKSANLTHKAQNITKLQPVRQLARDVEVNLDIILDTKLLKSQIAQTTIDDVKKLKQLLLGDKGWFNLKIEQLQTSGRTRGLGNFLHNLILDITRHSETRFYEINKSIVDNAQRSAKNISEQVIWLISLAVTLLIMISTTIYFINHKIVARLLALNESVLKRMQSEDAPIDASGKDEISRLAQSFIYFSKKVEAQKQQLQLLSLTDGLTNLPNRRAMDERLVHDINSTKRGDSALSIIILDFDYFKAYNDHYGHIAGDVCLKSVALGLRGIQQRESDFIARYGGEEFVMLLPTTEKQGAINVAIRIKQMLELLNLPHETNKVNDYVTVSIGIATFCKDTITTADEMLDITDQALYHAKASGRNTFVHSDDIAP